VRVAAASINLTIAVAMATLVAVGGILAGPAILDCSKNPGGIGACLRDRLDPPGPVTPPAPPFEDGWIDAAANEYEPPAVAPVELESSPANLTVAGLPPDPPMPPEIVVAPAAELDIASPQPDEEIASVAIAAPPGDLTVVSPEPTPDPITTAALSQPPAGDIAITATPEPIFAVPPPVTLSAEPTAVAPEPEPSPEEPTLVVEFNPIYPNVIVLPAPLSGDDSSFRALELN
jgi:hypothetical protein